MYNRILAVLLAVSLFFVLAVNTSAAQTIPDLIQTGSLTFTMDVDGEPLDSGNVNLYYVATAEYSNEAYSFELLDALIAGGATLDTDDLYDDVQAIRLLSFAQEILDEYLSEPIEDGEVRFTDLKAGLYLVWQRPEDASEGCDAMAPFLISIPKMQGGKITLDVTGKPKVPLETTPTTPPPPSPPPPPNVPQTGQLNWPVPVMAVTGVVLLLVGWVLCAGRKRCDDEN